MVYYVHPLIKDGVVEERRYQVSIARSSLGGNTLVILPTALGKTVIATMVVAEVLHARGGKALFLAPTRPLVVQHMTTLRSFLNLPSESIQAITGSVNKKKRGELYQTSRVIVATPQVVRNDIISGVVDLSEFSVMVVDEAHRAVGGYPYVFIASEYFKNGGHLLFAMTASPGANEEHFREVIEGLKIENIELRDDNDDDVKPYIHRVSVRYVEVEMSPAVKSIRKLLMDLRNDIVRELHTYGIFSGRTQVTRRDLLEAQREVSRRISSGDKSFYKAALLITETIKVDYALEYLESQGVEAFIEYLKKIINDSTKRGTSKASKELVSKKLFREVYHKAQDLVAHMDDVENPKLSKLKELIDGYVKKYRRVIVFTHYRKTSQVVADALNNVPGVRAARFIGQGMKVNDRGLSQKEQVAIIDDFREGKYNVLVATSVAEEGLDIPSTDVVIFYEPVPSEIRSIQRRGRTGRGDVGHVIILATKGTRDMAYLWSSRKKEKTMKERVEKFRQASGLTHSNKTRADVNTPSEPPGSEINKSSGGDVTLFDFEAPDNSKPEAEPEDDIKLLVDSRELNSGVAEHLRSMGVPMDISNLDIGDYLLPGNTVVERKDARDFVSSVMDGRLFAQMKSMKSRYPQQLLVVEGEVNFASLSRQNFFGVLASVVLDFNIPVIFLKTPHDTADFLATAYKRAIKEKRPAPIRHEKPGSSTEDMQLFIVESLPGVSAVLARRLLEHFGSVRNLFTATKDELMEVKGVGEKIAEGIIKIFEREYVRR